MKFLAFFSALILSGSFALSAIQTKDVEYTQGDAHCKGFVAWDDSKDKAVGVLIVPEWWGMTDYPKNRAKQLAELGYVAFVVDMYGDGKSTNDPKQAGQWADAVKGDRNLMRARAQAGLD